MFKTSFAALSICFLFFTSFQEQSNTQTSNAVFTGAWGYNSADSRTVMIFAGNVFAAAQYDVAGKKLLHSYGGTWKLEPGNCCAKSNGIRKTVHR